MADWDMTSIGKVLAGCSISVAGILIAAFLLGFSVPYGLNIMFTCIVLTVISAGVIIVRLRQDRTDAAGKT